VHYGLPLINREILLSFFGKEDTMKESSITRKKWKNRLIVEVASTVTIVGGLVAFWRWKCWRPKLELTDRFFLGDQGVRSAGTVRLFVENTGRATAKDIFIRLKVIKPADARPKYKLFFNEDVGSLESYREPGLLDTARYSKPETYDFRLKPEIFVNPGITARLEIAYFIVFTVEKTKPEALDHEIEWTVHYGKNSANTGIIKKSGIDIKRQLLKNEYESGHVIGYEIPSNILPADDSD
jgi:hypothetical protein